MADYRVRLRLQEPIATPFLSGTLFGHLCWAKWHLEGEDALEHWLQEMDENPLLLSDGLPAGWLPRPLLKPSRRRTGSVDTLERFQREKSLRKREWIPMHTFLELRNNLSEARLMEALDRITQTWGGLTEHRLAHNTISRLTGTTPAAGGLYFVDEHWPGEPETHDWDVYVRGEIPRDLLQALFSHCGTAGYGRDASLGRGQFTATVEEAEPALFSGRGNRLLSLSHGCLSGNMLEPRYKVHTHYGKLGPVLAVRESPFKYPLILLRAGATFSPGDGGPFDAMLSNVHPQLEYVRHHTLHLTLPFTEPEA